MFSSNLTSCSPWCCKCCCTWYW